MYHTDLDILPMVSQLQDDVLRFWYHMNGNPAGDTLQVLIIPSKISWLYH